MRDRGQPLVALLPTGVFLAQQAFWAPKTISYVLLFLGTTAFLLVLARLVFSMRAWDAAGVDYAEDIRLDVLLTGAGADHHCHHRVARAAILRVRRVLAAVLGII